MTAIDPKTIHFHCAKCGESVLECRCEKSMTALPPDVEARLREAMWDKA